MFQHWSAKVVEALVETFCWSFDDPASCDAATIQRVADFVTAQRHQMPDYLRLPMLVVTLLCDAGPLVGRSHVRFHKLSLAARREVVAQWRTSRFSVVRDFVRFYETLSVFGSVAERHEPTTPSTVS